MQRCGRLLITKDVKKILSKLDGHGQGHGPSSWRCSGSFRALAPGAESAICGGHYLCITTSGLPTLPIPSSSSAASPSVIMEAHADASIPPDLQVGQQIPRDENAPPERANSTTPSTTQPAEKWTKTVHPRGRQARDPLAQNVHYDCTGADQMEVLLREYLANPTSPAEHTTIEFAFPTSSAFMVYTGDYSGGSQPKTNLYGTLNRSALSVHAALAPPDPKESLKKQKSIAKTLIEHVQRADGYRYSFHNNWLSKDDAAHRFSYFCNDSTLNKGRAANEAAGMAHKRKMKPVYDCAGTIHVKFSVTKQSLGLFYKHTPCHKTYEERAPQPRKNSKRRKIMEVFEPEKLAPRKIGRPKVDQSPKPRRTSGTLSARGKPSKQRRATEPPPGTAEAAADPATDGLAPLLEFLDSDEQGANGAQDTPILVDEGGSSGPPPVFSAGKLNELKKQTRNKNSLPIQGLVRAPALQVPGMMTGYMSGDLIMWGSNSGKRQRLDQDPAPASSTADATAGPLAGIAQAAAEVEASETDSPVGLSEIEQLKAKLAAAEARINRLESEKGPSKNGSGPPGWPPPPAPPSYTYPPPQFGHVPYPQVPNGPSQAFGYLQPPQPQQQPHPSQASQSQPKAQQAQQAKKSKQRAEFRAVQFDPSALNAKVAGQLARKTNSADPSNQPQPPKGGQIVPL